MFNISQEEDKSITTDTVQSTSDEDTNENSFTSHSKTSVRGSILYKLQRPSVKNILNLTAQGRAILKSYTKNKILSRKCRNIIVDLVLSEILNNIKR